MTAFVLFLISLTSLAGPYAGKTLRVLTFRDSHSKAVHEKLKSFEEKTGATVILDRIAGQDVATKTSTDQIAGGSYDLYAVDEPYMPQLSVFFVPLKQWPETKIYQKQNSLEFLSAALKGGAYQGTQYGLPINGNVYMYVYRRDLFEDTKEKASFKAKYGYDLKVPNTMDQFRDVAEFFYRPPSLYGFAPFTKKSEGTTVEAIWILKSFGVELFDDSLNLVLDSKKASKALSFYSELMKFSPVGSKSWHHSERMAAYSAGKVAQIMTWPSFLGGLEDPRQSKVVGKSAFAAPPSAVGGQSAPVAGTWTLAISKNSANKELASEFAHWWGASEHSREFVAHGMNPARVDLLSDKYLAQQNPSFQGILANFKVAVVRPRFPKYKKVSEIISSHFTRVASGMSSAEQAAEDLHSELKAVRAF